MLDHAVEPKAELIRIGVGEDEPVRAGDERSDGLPIRGARQIGRGLDDVSAVGGGADAKLDLPIGQPGQVG